jgi:eukaryotic-like serine/threonine-protein kinase
MAGGRPFIGQGGETAERLSCNGWDSRGPQTAFVWWMPSRSIGECASDRPRSMPMPSSLGHLGRFEIVQALGEGGSGIVYSCKDASSGATLAMKELRLADADAIFRFKREFRLLSQLEHPHLIRLRELHEAAGNWFFTMDQVEGVDFLEWVCSPAGTDLERLRRSLDELTSAVAALHGAGYAHCDIKSQNVRVDQNGKVVVLDLGLATPLDSSLRVEQDRRPNGTPSYMAPEQAAGQDVTTASDLYSIGVLLFAALTGKFPFEGSRKEVLRNKQVYEACWPALAVAPPDLRDACLALLRINPHDRPTLSELRDVLGFTRMHPSDVFVGRISELETLRAHDVQHRDRFSAVLISGESGIGKTSLAATFVATTNCGIVLRARCYDCEAVPFNALDGVVDGLSRAFEDAELESALQRLEQTTRASLVRHFPILNRGGRANATDDAPLVDRIRARSRAVEGLAFLLGKLAERRRVYIFIDDLHWADADSAQALGALFAAPSAPPIAFVATYRPTGAALVEAVTRDWDSVRAIPLSGLSLDDAGVLADTYGIPRHVSESYAADCAGHPLFLRTLLSAHIATGGATSSGGLDGLLGAIVGDVGIDEQKVIGLLSLCPRPLQRRALREASGLGIAAFSNAITSLSQRRLARSRGPLETDTVESYHDRTARIVRSRLRESVRLESHRQLSRAMSLTNLPPEDMLDHLEAIGNFAAARLTALEAARASRAAFAFAHAASLFGRAVRLSTATEPDLGRVLVELGETLALAGQARRAATAYLEAASEAPRAVAFDLRRFAADQLIYSGAVAEGLAVLEPEMLHYGVSVHASRLRVLAGLLARRLGLRLRGLAWKPGAAPIGMLQQIDVLWTLCRMYSFVDSALASSMHAWGLRLALDAGDPARIARALALELGFLAMAGETRSTRYAEVEGRARSAANLANTSDARVAVEGGVGVMKFLTGHWQEAHVKMDAVAARLEQINVVTWERRTAEFVALTCLDLCGELREVRRRLPRLLREADASEDALFSTSLRLRISAMVALYDDDPDGALRCIQAAKNDWPFKKGVQQYYALISEMRTLLYCGRPDKALRLFQKDRRSLDDAYFAAPASRVETDFAVGTALLTKPSTTEGRSRDLRVLLRRLESTPSPVTGAMHRLLEAGFFAQVESHGRARRTYESAADALDLQGLTLHAISARWRAAELAGDLTEVERLNQTLSKATIRNPAAIVQMVAPKPLTAVSA